jgi:hypothetical protein
VTAATHFVQAGDAPILIGAGAGTLACSCGGVLVDGYDPARFLAIAIQCGRCGTVTTTPGLPEGALPPRSAIIAGPTTEPRATPMTVPAGVSVVGQAEMNRLRALFQPAAPNPLYRVSAALLDDAAAAFERHTGAPLPDRHPLGAAVRHLSGRMRADSWACMEDSVTAIAVTQVTGFLHFLATWARHPLLPAMVATAGEQQFSVHGLAPFAAVHCFMMMGNQIRFPDPLGYPGRLEGFGLVAGDDAITVHVDVFDRFEFPHGRPWDQAGLRGAVADVLEAAQARINLRHPGVLVLSPGNAMAGYDEALIAAIRDGVQNLGRKNRGLAAMAMIALRLQAQPDPHAVRLGYALLPAGNRHYRGDNPVRMAGR